MEGARIDFENGTENGCGPKEGKEKIIFRKHFSKKKNVLDIEI
jgi:hypothetical protein